MKTIKKILKQQIRNRNKKLNVVNSLKILCDLDKQQEITIKKALELIGDIHGEIRKELDYKNLEVEII